MDDGTSQAKIKHSHLLHCKCCGGKLSVTLHRTDKVFVFQYGSNMKSYSLYLELLACVFGMPNVHK